MISRIYQKSATPIFGPKGFVHPRVARPSPWPRPESRTTPFQVGADDVDITPIQTMHGPTTRAHTRKLNLQVRSNLVNCVLEFTLGACNAPNFGVEFFFFSSLAKFGRYPFLFPFPLAQP
jgi:hypothetical protein